MDLTDGDQQLGLDQRFQGDILFRNPKLIARKQKGRFCGHFSRVVVSDFRSLRGDIVFRPFLARQSPAAKIPFQTRIGRLIARVREASSGLRYRDCLCS